VSIDVTENVIFTNLDTQEAHWPTLATNQIGAAPSANSSQCTVPAPQTGNEVTYGCKIPGHENEQGVISVFAVLSGPLDTSGDPKPQPIILTQATQNVPITKQQLVAGGKSPYTISNQVFQITAGPPPTVIQSGNDSIGPGLQLSATDDNTGVWVTGTPTVVGTYLFTFVVDDGMGKNLQQVQYSMVVGS
jgi:hypothetical protein